MHANEMKNIHKAQAGQVLAALGIDYALIDTFRDGSVRYTMTSMNIHELIF